jgi:hypothetical protein
LKQEGTSEPRFAVACSGITGIREKARDTKEKTAMARRLGIGLALVAGALLVGVPMAQGLVIDESNTYYTDYKDWAKFRQDVGKQISKLTDCYTKALVKCDGKVDPSTDVADWPAQCNISNPPASTIADPKAKEDFGAAVDKCTLKVDFAKKNPADPNLVIGYRDIGCPAEDPPYVANDLGEYQEDTIGQAKTTIATIAILLPNTCASVTTTNPELKNCIVALGKAAGNATKGVFKCATKCENDYKNKIGNGGTTDTSVCASAGGPTGALGECVTKATDKGQKLADKDPGAKEQFAGTFNILVKPQIDDSINDLYNKCLCGSGVGLAEKGPCL